MKAVITGAAGFIGSTLAGRLLAAGADVVGVDAFRDYYDPAIKRANLHRLEHARFHHVEADLIDLDMTDVLDGADVVVHLAGQPGVRASWGAEFSAYTDDNVNATQRVLEATRRVSPQARVLYASSSSVYGQALSYPTDENVLPRPYSPYGVTKLAGEHLVGLYRENFGLDTASFRFFTVYGPRQRPDMAFHRFLTSALEGRALPVNGDGEQVRDFTFIDDIVDALVRAAGYDGTLPPVMNLSGGSHVTINEVLAVLGELLGAPPEVVHGPAVPGDVRRTGGDSALARRVLGWAPGTTIAEGLARQLESLRRG